LAEGLVDPIADEKTYPEEWDYRRLNESLMRLFSFGLDIRPGETAEMTRERLLEKVLAQAKEAYQRKEVEFGAEAMRHLEKVIYLQSIDTLWKEHLMAMEPQRGQRPARLRAALSAPVIPEVMLPDVHGAD
jgi:preprotein translocase subunit SecA